MFRPHREGVVVEVWVVPGSSRDLVGGIHDGALRVRTTAPPSGGAANRAVAHLVAGALGGKTGQVVSGHRGRRKRILVRGVSPERAAALLGDDESW